MSKKSFAAGAVPQTPLGELTSFLSKDMEPREGEGLGRGATVQKRSRL